jgi:heme/copper-type cytochrome/quinol oxidase subunit 2
MKNKKMFLISGVALVVIAIFGIISIYAFPGQATGSGVDNPPSLGSNNEVQKATLTMQGYEYVLTPNTLKSGVPAEITVDLNTVVGCMRDVTIREFGVRKYVSDGDNKFTFTPTKEGTFLIACSMNMGRGYFSVTSDGSASKASAAAVNTAKANIASTPSGTCGIAAGGGCGCGR